MKNLPKLIFALCLAAVLCGNCSTDKAAKESIEDPSYDDVLSSTFHVEGNKI